MEFRILGPLEVLENGRQLELGGAKQQALLAILLLHANEVVSSDRLIDALWEDHASETGRKALQVYVSQLRMERDLETARQSTSAGVEFARTQRSRMSVVAFRLQSTMLQRAHGELDKGLAVMEQSVVETPTLTAFRCILASLYAERGRDVQARAILDALADMGFEVLPDNDKLYGWSLLAEVCQGLGDVRHAPRLYELLSPYAERNVVCHPGCAIGSVSRYLGILAALLQRYDDAARHFEDALVMNEEMGARPWLAHTQEDYARMLFERDDPGDRKRARELLSTALATYRELGMDGPLVKATALAARY